MTEHYSMVRAGLRTRHNRVIIRRTRRTMLYHFLWSYIFVSASTVAAITVSGWYYLPMFFFTWRLLHNGLTAAKFDAAYREINERTAMA